MDCQDLGRCLSFIVGCLGMMLAGCIFAVPIYTNAVKEKFDYDQWIGINVYSCDEFPNLSSNNIQVPRR